MAVFLGSGLACNAPSEPTGDILTTEVPLYSAFNEEVVIRDFFKDRRRGFFVDVGCATPIARSNTYYLEKHLGWSGIGVDALAVYAKAWEDARPNSKFFGYWVTDTSGETLPYYRSRIAGFSSLSKDAALIFDPKPTEFQVPTITLNQLLDDNGVTHIDLLSLKIANYELDALNGFDIDRFKPELVCVSLFSSVREGVFKYFAEHGYESIERYVPHGSGLLFFTPRANREAS